nr:class II glutamine amidotransferase [Bacillus sp. ISL-4]
MPIGHVRYSTSGESLLQNAHPLVFKYSKGDLAVAHNGNLINARRELGCVTTAGKHISNNNRYRNYCSLNSSFK